MLRRYSNFWNQLEGYLKQGLDPKKLAITIALGMVIGIFPVIGTTTVLCLLIAVPFKLNIAVIQLANYLVYPLQLLLFIPIIKLGSYLFGAPPIPNLEYALENSTEFLKIFWVNCLFGVVVWFVLAIPLYMVIYYLLHHALRKKVS